MDIFKHANEQMINNALLGVRQKFPLLDSTLDNLQVVATDEITSCATDSKSILYNPKFLENLSYDQRVFALSHEVLHVAFDHILRSKDKDADDWNIATDSVINKILKDNGLPMIDGGVDMDEAQGKSADEMYDLIHDPNKTDKQEQQNSQGGSGNSQGKQTDDSQQGSSQSDETQVQSQQNEQAKNEQNGSSADKSNGEHQQNSANVSDDDQSSNGEQSNPKQSHISNHDIWQEAVKKHEIDQEKINKRLEELAKQLQSKPEAYDDEIKSAQEPMSDFEKEFGRKNQEKKEEKGRELIRQLKDQVSAKEAGKGNSISTENYTLGEVGKADKALSWKTILKRYLDDEVSLYSYRRADEDNYFQARIEDLEQFDMPGVEVMLDASLSVSDDLLKEFLRQLKHLMRGNKLKAGCFSDSAYKFVEIKKMSDIDNFQIQGRSGTNFYAAADAFTWKGKDARCLNRIIFTDGEGMFLASNNKYKQLIWVVYDNPSFRTDFGRVIHVNSKQILESKSQDLEIL